MDRAYQRLFHVAQVSGSALGLTQFWILEAERNLLALQWLLPLKQHIDELTTALHVTEAGVTVPPLPEQFPWTYGEGKTSTPADWSAHHGHSFGTDHVAALWKAECQRP